MSHSIGGFASGTRILRRSRSFFGRSRPLARVKEARSPTESPVSRYRRSKVRRSSGDGAVVNSYVRCHSRAPLDAGGPTCLLQLDFCSVLFEIEYLAVVVHAHADGGPHEGIWSLERQSLAFVAHENIRDSRVIVLYSHLTAGGVELQNSPVAEVIWIEDFP